MNQAKIQATHLQRNAYVYVRQSTQHQVLHHLESQQRQYELARHAGELGWQAAQVIVIDDDLGRSASGRDERTGFQRLVSDVALGRAGLVLGLEVSRLARNNGDWYRLLDLCAVRQTLIADMDGVYDPAAFNDRLLLGLKGTMSEAELHVLRGRMLAGLRHKAEKGELRFRLPIGYEFGEQGIVKTNNEEVGHLVSLIFSKMFELGSVSAVTKYLLHEELRLPRRHCDGSTHWSLPYYRAVYLMIRNPIYAGAYAYGRGKTVPEIGEDGVARTRRRERPLAQWDVLIHDHHPAYISWELYERILRMLEKNRPAPSHEASLALRDGTAMLQGMVRCGKCGRSMMVSYSETCAGRTAPSYCCKGASRQNCGTICQAMGGRRIDAAVTQFFLEALSSAELDLHLSALRRLDSSEDALLRQLGLDLERARFEAGRAERQYTAVEPENRVVARTLETRWNQALVEVELQEARLEQRKREAARPLSMAQESELRALAADLSKLWHHERTTEKDRKALLRAVIDEVQLLKRDREVDIRVVWKGGAITDSTVTLPRVRPSTAATPDLVALVAELARRLSDPQVARVLNRRGLKTPKGLPFTAMHVAGLRRNYGIACFPASAELRKADHYTVVQAARILGVSGPTIRSWLKLGILVGEQATPSEPWSIQVSARDRERLMSAERDGWLSVDESAVEFGVSKQTVLNWVKAGRVDYVYVNHGRRRGLRIDVESAPCRNQGCLLDRIGKDDVRGGVV
jgi:DNA invertase Pin-like site-specific DNA recombinase